MMAQDLRIIHFATLGGKGLIGKGLTGKGLTRKESGALS